MIKNNKGPRVIGTLYYLDGLVSTILKSQFKIKKH